MTDETPGPASDRGQDPELDASGGFVLATYREIAARFRLGGPNAARTKVKRAGWRCGLRPDHPSDPLRIQVPREAWDRASEIPHRAARASRPKSAQESTSRGRAFPSHDKEIPHLKALVALLREQVERERLIADEARAGHAAAERRAARAEDDLRAERDGFHRRREEPARLAALQPVTPKSPDPPSIRDGLAELAAEFTASSTEQPLGTEPASLPSILEGLSELARQFSVSPPELLRAPTLEAPTPPVDPPVRFPTKPAGLDELPAQGAVPFAMRREAEGPIDPPVVLPIELDRSTVTARTGIDPVAALPVEGESAPERGFVSPLQQDQVPVAVAKGRPRWLRLRRPSAF